MPWKESSVMEERLRFVARFLDGEGMIEVHVFCCVLALLLTSLLQRDLRRRGLDRSLDALFEQLGTIREVGLLHPPHGSRRKPRLERVVSSMSEDQRALYEALDLQRYMDS